MPGVFRTVFEESSVIAISNRQRYRGARRRGFLSAAVLLLGSVLFGPTASAQGEVVWVDGSADVPDPDGSPEKPFPTIGRGLSAAGAGDTVTVKQGVYRETLSLPWGQPGRPITLRSAEGERVIVSGLRPIDGWRAGTGTVWTALTDWEPKRLYVGLQRRPVSREPDEGWWKAAAVETDAGDGNQAIVDPANLAGLAPDLAGGSVYIWTETENSFFLCPIVSFDPAAGRLVFTPDPAMHIRAGDKYQVRNHPALLDRTGEWAAVAGSGVYRVYFAPVHSAELEQTQGAGTVARVVSGWNLQHFRLRGLEIVGGTNEGIYLEGIDDVEISWCTVHDNIRYGLRVRSGTNFVVRSNLVYGNEYGVALMESVSATVDRNEIASNEIDGLLVTWGSDDVTVSNNYVHGHLFWGHPDNVQMYRTANHVRYVDNLIITGGQSVMMQETRDGEFSGNMILGSGATMLIFGDEAGYYTLRKNTVAFAGYSCMSLTWRDYDVRENVFMTGQAQVIYSVAGVTNYDGDRNLFWNSVRVANPTVLASDAGWHGSLEEFQAATGEDPNSVYANPRFVHAPILYGVLDDDLLTECTRETLILRSSEGFQVGDHVEINFDGTVRTIVSMQGRAIVLDPPLDEKPLKGWLVADWGVITDYDLDLRLRPESPGYALGADGSPVGSSISIEEYRAGDFDGDGEPDRPAYPEDPPDGDVLGFL